jgi:regulator of ribonuclease activity A
MSATVHPRTTDLCDAHPESQSCETQFKRFGRRRSFFGRIRTVKCNEDNALLKTVIAGAGRGDVLVIDGGGSYRCALMGDVIARLGLQNGWAGAVINGVVRDATALDALDFAVKALGSNPRRGGKSGAGQVDVPVTFGGVTFTPGHWLYSDEDGILVSDVPLTD